MSLHDPPVTAKQLLTRRPATPLYTRPRSGRRACRPAAGQSPALHLARSWRQSKPSTDAPGGMRGHACLLWRITSAPRMPRGRRGPCCAQQLSEGPPWQRRRQRRQPRCNAAPCDRRRPRLPLRSASARPARPQGGRRPWSVSMHGRARRPPAQNERGAQVRAASSPLARQPGSHRRRGGQRLPPRHARGARVPGRNEVGRALAVAQPVHRVAGRVVVAQAREQAAALAERGAQAGAPAALAGLAAGGTGRVGRRPPGSTASSIWRRQARQSCREAAWLALCGTLIHAVW